MLHWFWFAILVLFCGHVLPFAPSSVLACLPWGPTTRLTCVRLRACLACEILCFLPGCSCLHFFFAGADISLDVSTMGVTTGPVTIQAQPPAGLLC